MYTLHQGSQGQLVTALRALLNNAVVPSPNLPPGSKFDIPTRNAVVQFQLSHSIRPDGKVGPHTWGALGNEIGDQDLPMQLLWSFPDWLRKLLSGKGTANGFNTAIFFGMYMEEWGGIKPDSVAGLETLLAAIAMDRDVSDIRWAAYMLATVKHECADTWKPIEEYGKGAGQIYGQSVTVKDKQGNSYTNKYYGRGYVQLTWKDNYDKLGQALGMGDDLLIHPEKALAPPIAYKIMSYGMRNGSFTGKKLSDYIQPNSCDYKNARKIINGLDQWQLIKGYAEKLETMLRACAAP